MEAKNERLFRVMGDVGSDLIANAEQKTFPRSIRQKLLPVAACLALLLGLGYLARPYLIVQQPPAAVEAPTAQPEELPPVEPPVTPEVVVPGPIEPAQPREQLVFWDTVYYVEAHYAAEQAEPLLDGCLGWVEEADDPANDGAPVYRRRDSAVKADSMGREVPLEIFVKTGDTYLYCLTYYDTSLPLLEFEAVQALERGKAGRAGGHAACAAGAGCLCGGAAQTHGYAAAARLLPGDAGNGAAGREAHRRFGPLPVARWGAVYHPRGRFCKAAGQVSGRIPCGLGGPSRL